jgi:Glycosyl hydrolase family 3 C-terminal domain
VFLLAVSADPDTAPAEAFEHELRSQIDSLTSLHVDTKYFRVEETQLPSPDSYDLAICAMTVRVADRKGTVGLPPNETEMIHALLRAGKPVIMVGLGSPYLMESFPEATTWLAAFSVQDVAERAAARALLGTFAVSGKLPVSLPGAAPHALRVGEGFTTAAIPLTIQPASAEMTARLQSVFALLDQAVRENPRTIGELRVGYRGEEAVHPFGVRARITGGEGARVVALNLTRIFEDPPILTTTIARLAQAKQLTLDTPLETLLQGTQPVPEEGLKGVTLRELLEGTSGLELTRRPGKDTSATHEVLSVASGELPWRPAGRAEREAESLVVSTLTGLEYTPAVQKLVLAPLGFSLKGDPIEIEGSTLALVGQLWLNGGIYAHKRLLTRLTLAQFTALRREKDEVFTAGWEVSQAPGHSFSPSSYGWTNGAWESLWVDPERELYAVLLINGPVTGAEQGTGPPSREKIRAEVHDAIFAALGLGPAK